MTSRSRSGPTTDTLIASFNTDALARIEDTAQSHATGRLDAAQAPDPAALRATLKRDHDELKRDLGQPPAAILDRDQLTAAQLSCDTDSLEADLTERLARAMHARGAGVSPADAEILATTTAYDDDLLSPARLSLGTWTSGERGNRSRDHAGILVTSLEAVVPRLYSHTMGEDSTLQGRIGRATAGPNLSRCDDATHACAINTHELGHLASIMLHADRRPGRRPAFTEDVLEECRADAFTLAMEARRGGDWQSLFQDMHDHRAITAITNGSLTHWTAPTLRALATDLEGTAQQTLAAMSPGDLMTRCDRLARQTMPDADALVATHAALGQRYTENQAVDLRRLPAGAREIVGDVLTSYRDARISLAAPDATPDRIFDAVETWIDKAAERAPERARLVYFAIWTHQVQGATPNTRVDDPEERGAALAHTARAATSLLHLESRARNRHDRTGPMDPQYLAEMRDRAEQVADAAALDISGQGLNDPALARRQLTSIRSGLSQAHPLL